MAAIATMTIPSWITDIWNSVDKLSSIINRANWRIAATLLLGFVFTAIVIVAGNRKDSLLRVSELEKEKEIAQTKKTTAELTANNLALEAQIAPRRLTAAQQQSIAHACARFAGRQVRVVSYALDAEAGILAKQIVATLQGAGMKVDDATASVMPLGGFSLGIHVSGPEQDLVAELSKVLASFGNLAVAAPSTAPSGPSVSTDNTSNVVPVSILVGVKPI
jgi:cell division protein FtsB